MHWVDTSPPPYVPTPTAQDREARTLLNQAKLEELGFDCHVPPSDPSADTYYASSRQSARTGFVALEYDGPAWQSWIEWRDRVEATPLGGRGKKRAIDFERTSGSRLAVIDAGPDAHPFCARGIRSPIASLFCLPSFA